MMLLFQVFLSVVIIFEFRMMRWEIFTKFSHIQNKILKIEKSTSPKSESATTSVFSLLAFSFFEVFGLGFGFSSSSLSENVLYLILLLFSCLRLELEVFVLNILIQLANSISIFFLFQQSARGMKKISIEGKTKDTNTERARCMWCERLVLVSKSVIAEI